MAKKPTGYGRPIRTGKAKRPVSHPSDKYRKRGTSIALNTMGRRQQDIMGWKTP